MKRLLPVLLAALPLVATAQRKPAAAPAKTPAKTTATPAATPRPAAPASLAPLPVPAEIQFAGLRLRLSDGGRAAVQQKVDALRRHPGSYQQRVAAADAAFPIIERVFQEEGVPLDFRFLCIQESGLQGDAQSIHDAIGYWQFKREAAADFGLEVSDAVDERKHLVAATHGAAKYLLRSQRMYQNWLHTLLSYNLGLGGVKPYTLPTDAKATEMQITEQTHPYILTFLAHKLAYEPGIGTNPRPAMLLREYPAVPGQSLPALAQALQTNPAELSRHNRWLLAAAVPTTGKTYTALVPVTDSLQLLAMAVQQRQVATKLVTAPETDARNAAFVTVNGMRAVVALPNESKEELARRAGVKLRKFMQFNDLMPFDRVVAGQPYFTQKKRDKAAVEYHVTQAGESLVTVSQKYGVRARAIRSKNRMAANEPLQPGRVLWLQHTRPRAVAVEFVQDQTGAVAAAMERPTGAPAPAPAPVPATPAPTPAPKRKPAEAEVYTGRTAAAQRAIDDAPEAEQDSSRIGGLLSKLGRKPAAAEPEADTVAVDTTVETINEVAAEAPAVAPAAPAPKPARGLYTGEPTEKKLPAAAPLADEPSGNEPDEEPAVASAPVVSKPAATPAPAPKPAAPAPKPAVTEPKPVAAEPKPTTPTPVAATPATPKPAPTSVPKTTPAAPTAAVPAPKPAASPATPAADPTMTPGAGWPIPASGQHTVQAKETLYGVARRYNLRPADLVQWNALPPNPSLQLGQVLRLTPPTGTAAPAPTAAAAAPKTPASAPAKPAPAAATTPAKPASTAPAATTTPAKPASTAPAATTAAKPAPAAPAAKPVAAAGTIKHTVVAKETLFSISQKYKVKPAQIMQWNNKTEETVRLGEVLTIQPGR
ncbi:lytic transglycosylase [Hymenobacter gummosus]|uniref:Lytic transglycosylase n=1 Tax=Hymenobacter gummosus TaxID=1776032 RepID=A0A431U4H9_9BACT|nr:LysM peptidoglycan-binding domain-containing protein [Hymenobacter gummosus]RTQ50261.1 lytic transglycosylase [Hymenobacter gummosus]